MKRLLLSFVLPAAVALAVAGCGSSKNSSNTNSTNAGAAPTQTSSGGASASGTVVSAKSSPLGQVLVDASGRTLYLFEADHGTTSSCSGACVSTWPPLVSSGQPKAGSGVPASKLGTTKRSDGSTQVTYNNHPLYTYSGDTGAGQTSGQGINSFGGLWYVLSPGGQAITSSGSSSGSSGGSGSGGY